MVFSDPVFLFAFLPITFCIYYGCRLFLSGNAAIAFLVVASCIFYAYWSIPYLFLLLGQLAVNYLIARDLSRQERRGLLMVAVIFNLALLGYFKYRNFFLENVEDLFGVQFLLTRLVVPLAISFHTFQQIALLADIKDGEAKLPPFLEFVFFVVFFPQLIAGPIVLHREMGKQVAAARKNGGMGLSMFVPGFFLFIFGLWKKVCLADMLAPHVDLAFYPGLPLLLPEAWLAVIGYALQLFMDFSGYSDMAVGLGLMFGFRLPHNFLIPFSSTSMIEYWKRWHMTMTRFFTMYVYMPVSLSLTRTVRRRKFDKVPAFALSVATPTAVTFLASGLWHGAGWTFIMFGVTNAIGIVINHIWKDFHLPRVSAPVGWLLTAVMILITLAYFRAIELHQANYILHQMFVPSAFGVPSWLAAFAGKLHLPVSNYEWLRDPPEAVGTLAWIIILAPLSVLLPALSAKPESIRPTWRNAFALAAMGLLVISLLDQPRSFLYFAF